MMLSRSNWIILGLAVLVAGAGGYWQRQAGAPPASTPLVGQPAPVLKLSDLSGTTHDLADYRGHPVVLNFWASWCLPCREEMPALDRAQQRHGASGATVIGVAMDQPAPVRAFLAAHPVSYPIVLGQLSHPSSAYRFGDVSDVLPYSVLIGTDGRVLAQHAGPLDDALLQQWLAPRAD
ncbi:MAG TPA: redoxin domain-containing protein [Rhodanobacter sp.]|nr:redoxin domain-containing protein [Rhodanobacter sp.]